MTHTISFSPRYLPLPPVRVVARQSSALPEHGPLRPSVLPPRRTLPFVPVEDQASQWMLLGMLAVTLPAVAYSLMQVWSLVGGDTLTHAIHAFIP